MEPIPKSGLDYPYKFARIAILTLKDVMGVNGVNPILNLAYFSHLIDNLPPNNLERKFDFADFSAISGALEEMFGPRGGRATFEDGLKNFGALVGVGDLAFKVLPQQISCALACLPWPKSFPKPAINSPPLKRNRTNLSTPFIAARFVGVAIQINRLVIMPLAC